jgi:hypothetical protein
MMQGIIYPDRIGDWHWVIMDGKDVYLRSERRFAHKCDARDDCDERTCLIRCSITFT